MKQEEKRHSVRFPPAVLDDIKNLAQEDQRSVNAEIVWIVQEYIKQRKGKQAGRSTAR
jgi:hypothetical protein